MTLDIMKTRQSSVAWVWLSFIVVLCDQLAKYFVLRNLVLGETHRILPFLNLTLAYNTGAAFSFLRGAGGWQGWLFGMIALIVSAAIIAWLCYLPKKKCWMAIALALILGGAIGNLLDRMVHGYVIDFISLHVKDWYWPTFNLADSCITIGAIMIALDVLFSKKKHV